MPVHLLNGVGINDAGTNWKNGEKRTHYYPWYSMITSEDYDVVDEWCRFSVFNEWYSPRWRPGYVLCCELAAPLGTRLHSPANTTLMPLWVRRIVKRQGYGIAPSTNGEKWIVRECRGQRRTYVGVYPTKAEAMVVADLLWVNRLRNAAAVVPEPELRDLLLKRAWEVYPRC